MVECYCSKCKKYIYNNFYYLILFPSKFGGEDEIHICENCFNKMWESFNPNEYREGIFN